MRQGTAPTTRHTEHATRIGAPPDAAALALTYASHWPADYVTGLKPTWPGGPQVGLLLYRHSAADAVVESLVIVACWLVYVRSLPPARRRGPAALLLPVGLIALQIAFAAIQVPAVKAPVRISVMPVASRIAFGMPVSGSNKFSSAISEGRPRW